MKNHKKKDNEEVKNEEEDNVTEAPDTTATVLNKYCPESKF